jgi:Flp pilus assembly protein CpaB
MPVDVFGLELPDEIAEGWAMCAHLAVAELRPDGSIELMLLTATGTLRYLATVDATDAEQRSGVVDAPSDFDLLASYVRAVVETNEPIVRRPTTQRKGHLLSVLPVLGPRQRAAVILEPDPTGRER